MSWIGRTMIRVFLSTAAGAAVLAPAATAQAAAEEYVKYYTVSSAYNGAPENLTEIAGRFLGSGARSADIYDLNAGRKQPDGKVLTDPARLRAGWLMIMPWDAVGPGIRYGTLPKKAPAATPKTKKPSAPASTPPAVGGATPATGTRPSPGAVPTVAVPPVTPACVSAAASSTKSDWARLRFAADKAWPQSRGKGQVVAVVDSGVNSAMPQLAGRISGGTDLVQPGQRGDADCLGTGTAMAALVVAKQEGDGPAGAAPDATVLPVRIAVNQPAATPEVQVKGIEAAVAAKATVIALGTYVDPSDPKVAQAIAAAAARDVVVVLGAPTPAKQADPDARIGEGVLWVAGVGVDDKWAVDYRKGAVDVAAPGVNVNSLAGTAAAGTGTAAGGTGTAAGAGTPAGAGTVAGSGTAIGAGAAPGAVAGGGRAVTGSGTHYAVAYTAAEVALVRAAYPDLTAQQVTHRIKVTADRMGDGEPPHSQFGWGFLNPGEAVTKVLPEEAAEVPAEPVPSVAPTKAADSGKASGDGGGGGSSTVLIVTALLMIVAALFLGHRIWRLLRKDDSDDVAGPAPEPEIDFYDARFRAPEPVLVGSGGPAPAPPGGATIRTAVDDGGEAHWNQVGGHWSDEPSGPPPGLQDRPSGPPPGLPDRPPGPPSQPFGPPPGPQDRPSGPPPGPAGPPPGFG